MTTFQPIGANWLTASWDDFIREDTELDQARGWPEYPSDMTGEGNWVDLYLTETEDFPVGRLWINPDSGDIGLEPLQFGNITYLTKIACELREFNHHGVSARSAYDYIKQGYFAEDESTGELTEAKVEIDISAN